MGVAEIYVFPNKQKAHLVYTPQMTSQTMQILTENFKSLAVQRTHWSAFDSSEVDAGN